MCYPIYKLIYLLTIMRQAAYFAILPKIEENITLFLWDAEKGVGRSYVQIFGLTSMIKHI